MKDTKKKEKGFLSSCFVDGLIALLPLGITVFLVYYILRLVYSWLSFLQTFIPPEFKGITWIVIIVDIVAVIALVFIIFLIGLFTKTIVGKWIGKAVNWIFHRLPLVSAIYKAFQQLTATFLLAPKEESKYYKPVLVEYPHRGKWTIAFITGEATPRFSPDKTKQIFTVYMPSSPMITTGFTMFVPADELILLDVSVEAAFKVVISGGFIGDEETVKEDIEELVEKNHNHD